MSAEIIQMEKGLRYAAQESSKWIEQLLDVIASAEVEYDEAQHVVHPVQAAVSTILTPTLEPKKKNKFMDVLAGGSKDMMGDMYNMIQGKKQ